MTETILAYAPVLLQVLLLYVLARSKAYKSFPWFFIYTVFSLLTTAARFALRNHEVSYFYVYWATDAMYSLLGGIVLYEVCRGVFGNLGRLKWGKAIFPCLILIAVLMTLTRTAKPLVGADWVMTAVVGAELGLRFLQVLMFAMLIVLVVLFGLRWRQRYFGISSGYGIYAAVNLFTTTKYYESGTKFTFLWGWVSLITYNVAVLIWLWYFNTPIEKETLSSEQQPPLSLQDLERYKDIARRVPRP